MKTFEQHLDDQNNILSDESKTKVCIIEDMNKLGDLMGWNHMSANTFDKYYDLTIKELEVAMSLVQKTYDKACELS